MNSYGEAHDRRVAGQAVLGWLVGHARLADK